MFLENVRASIQWGMPMHTLVFVLLTASLRAFCKRRVASCIYIYNCINVLQSSNEKSTPAFNSLNRFLKRKINKAPLIVTFTTNFPPMKVTKNECML